MGKVFTVGCSFCQLEKPSSITLLWKWGIGPFYVHLLGLLTFLVIFIPCLGFLFPLCTVLDFVLPKSVLKQQHCDKNYINLLIAQKLRPGFLYSNVVFLWVSMLLMEPFFFKCSAHAHMFSNSVAR